MSETIANEYFPGGWPYWTEENAVEFGPQPHPWLQFAGMFKHDPLIKEWRDSVEEYRQTIDDDQQAL